MKVSGKFLVNAALIAGAIAVVVGFQFMQGAGTVQASAEKDCICHAAGKARSTTTPQQYICITPSVNAVTENENGGHLNEDTTHIPNHAADFLCEDCSECGPPPSPEPSPSPDPTPSPSPSPE